MIINYGKSNIYITQTINGEPKLRDFQANIELKNKNLYIGEDKIFDIFGHNGQAHLGYVDYNHVDITKKGRELFNIPDEWTSHLTKVTIKAI